MPQGDEEAGAVKVVLKNSKQTVASNLDAAEVLQSGNGTLDFFSVFGIVAACVCRRRDDVGRGCDRVQ